MAECYAELRQMVQCLAVTPALSPLIAKPQSQLLSLDPERKSPNYIYTYICIHIYYYICVYICICIYIYVCILVAECYAELRQMVQCLAVNPKS